MPGKLILVATTVVVCGLAAGCSGTSGGGGGPVYFMVARSDAVVLVQWSAPQNGVASGDLTYDGPGGTASSGTMNVQTVPITVTINGTSVTFKLSGLIGVLGGGTVSGTLSGGILTITAPPDSSRGEITTLRLRTSDVAAYNAAMAKLRRTAGGAATDYSNPAVVAAAIMAQVQKRISDPGSQYYLAGVSVTSVVCTPAGTNTDACVDYFSNGQTASETAVIAPGGGSYVTH